MPTTDLFRLLGDARNEHFAGAYAVFLYDLPDKIGPDDLEAALEWAGGHRSRDDIGRIRHVVDAIVFRAFAHLDRPGVLSRVGDILIARAEAFQCLFEQEDKGSGPATDARRALIVHLPLG